MMLKMNGTLTLDKANVVHMDGVWLGLNKLIRLSFNLSVDAAGRDQEVQLIFNNDKTRGRYKSLVERSAPFIHGPQAFTSQEGLIIGYTGWKCDADMCIDLLVSLETGRNRNVTGSAAVAHGNAKQYAIKIGGAYLNTEKPITSLSLFLPNGGEVAGYVVPTLLA